MDLKAPNVKTKRSPDDQAQKFLAIFDPNPKAKFSFSFVNKIKSGMDPIFYYGTYDLIKKKAFDLNAKGYHAWFTINETSVKNPKNDNISAVRAVFLDLDGEPIEPVIESGIKPHAILETSPGKNHVYYKVCDCTLEEYGALQTAVALRFKGDDKVSDLRRNGRIPGFLNCKPEYAPAYPMVKLVSSNPDLPPYTTAQLVAGLGLDLSEGAKRYKEGAHIKNKAPANGDIESPSRNCDLFKIGMKLKNGLIDEPNTDQVIRTSLMAINKTLPEPLDESEVEGIVASILRRTTSRVRQVFIDLADKLNATYWRDDASQMGYWATIQTDDHREIIKIDSPEWHDLLMNLSYGSNGKELLRKHLSEATDMAKNRCAAQEKRHLYKRFAPLQDRVCIDLCNDKWEVIEIRPDGWEVKQLNEPIFWRETENLPLPTPVKMEGAIDEYLELLKITDPDERLLVKAWLVCAVLEYIPRPPLAVMGDSGSGKTEFSRALKRILDPHTSEDSTPPANLRDLNVAFMAHSIPIFDNGESLSPEEIAAYNRAVTGTGITERALYTNFGYVHVRLQRTFIINSVTPTNFQNDFWDRTIILERKRLSAYKGTTELKQALNKLIPGVLYWICETLSKAMSIKPDIKARRPSRMADWLEWGAAAMVADGVDQDAFEAAFHNNIEKASQDVVLDQPLFIVLQEFMNRHPVTPRKPDGKNVDEWKLSPSEFKKALVKYATELGYAEEKSWPKSTKSIKSRFQKSVSALSILGITAEWYRDGTGRFVIITRTRQEKPNHEIETDFPPDDRQSNENVIPIKGPKTSGYPDDHCEQCLFRSDGWCEQRSAKLSEMNFCPVQKFVTQKTGG